MASKLLEVKSVAPGIGQFNVAFEKDPYRDVLQIQNQSTEDLLIFFGDGNPLASGDETKLLLAAGSFYEPSVIPTNQIQVGTKAGASGPGLAWCAADFGTSVTNSTFAGIELLSTENILGNSLGDTGRHFGSGFGGMAGVLWSDGVMANAFLFTEDGGVTFQYHLPEVTVASVVVDEGTDIIYYVSITGEVYQVTPGNNFSQIGNCGLTNITRGKNMDIADGIMYIASGDSNLVAHNVVENIYTAFTTFASAPAGLGFKGIYVNDGYINLVDVNDLAVSYTWGYAGSVSVTLDGTLQLDGAGKVFHYIGFSDVFDGSFVYYDKEVRGIAPGASENFLVYTFVTATESPGIQVNNGYMNGVVNSNTLVAFTDTYESAGTYDLGSTESIFAYTNINGFTFGIGGTGDKVFKFKSGL